MDANDKLYRIRHSTAHVMAEAVLELFPEAKLAIGPPIDNGFYYDFDLPRPLKEEDLAEIMRRMKEIMRGDHEFKKQVVDRKLAKELFKEQRYKLELIDDLPAGEEISTYTQDTFTDLCRGPHVGSTRELDPDAFKLLSIAGAYWRGKESNPMLQRIYGTAWQTKKELESYLTQLEEAKLRDHRKIGRDLKLFVIDDAVGQGLILWTPAGAAVRQELQNFISAELRKQGYSQVFTPHIGRLELYRTSGHFPFYRDSQYPPLIERETLDTLATEGTSCADLANRVEKGEIDGYLLKPMNCPHHIKIYASQPRSYRELPVRLAEFGTVYRWEQSGELNGLTRVRGFTQDDAHLFCTEEQVPREILGCLALVKVILATLKMSDYRVRVGLRDPDSAKYIGDPANWDKAEAACREAAKTLGVPFSEEPGEASFYGPKIDFIIRDVIGREWQLGTVQVDYNLPQRFDLTYIGADNQEHRPVMIHRAPFGSMERFFGILIEHFAGAFPVWLAPVTAAVIPVAPAFADYAARVARYLEEQGIHASADLSDQRMNAKIRLAQGQKIPYMLVVGGKEQESERVSIRTRTGEQLQPMSLAECLQFIRGKIDAKEVI